jgi:cell division protein FtsN
MAAARRKKKSATRVRKTTTRRRSSGSRTRSGPRKLPNWSLLILGLAIGIVLAVLIQWVVNTARTPGTGLHNLLTRPAKPAQKAKTRVARPQPKTTYDFYNILPGDETVIPDQEWEDISRKSESGVQYVLQAAAYNNYQDADRLKAKLAINGLSSEIQKVVIGNKKTYYRVRLGPFDRAIDAEDANRRLAKLGIKSLRLKVKKN